MDKIRVGTSGNPPNFLKSDLGKDGLKIFEWLNSKNINAYEVIFTHGVWMKPERALKVKELSKQYDIKLSVHAPYFCVLTSLKPEVVEKSIARMKNVIEISEIMDAKRIVLHPGHYSNPNARQQLIDGLNTIIDWQIENNYTRTICIELMGKKSQFGSLSDIIDICNTINKPEYLMPCIDFGHYHARNEGLLFDKNNYDHILNELKTKLPENIFRSMHIHFSRIEFTDKGEKKHRRYDELEFGPNYQEFCDKLNEYGMSNPTIISESLDSQDNLALEIKNYITKQK